MYLFQTYRSSLRPCFCWFVFLLLPAFAFGQISQGGIPLSLQYKLDFQDVPVLNAGQPDRNLLQAEDDEDNSSGRPYRYAVNMPLQLDLLQLSGVTELSGNDRLYRLGLHAGDALALACYFADFQLPEGTTLFLYTPAGKQVLGAYTAANNQDNHLFATALLPGNQLYIEYFEPYHCRGQAKLVLSELSYAYRGVSFAPANNRGFGGSGACEVNVNCQEGINWQNQKRGVVRIAVKVGAGSFWCTGSLLNNVRQDFTPWLLTADHCGATATAADLSQWIFYFNYEGADCPDPLIEPGSKTMTGAVKKAAAGGNGGSIKEADLFLVQLNNMVPPSYNPYFCGWNRQNTASPSGTSIHHPQGDIKKISTYTSPTASSSWGSTPHSHWAVKWTATQNGHGVTEPGSSGSPLFNQQGLVMGLLSGGDASCSNLNGTDLYGKFSYSWLIPQGDSSNSLFYWLDPDNTNPVSIPGLAPDITYVIANFTVDKDTIVVGSTVNFTDLSSGNPISWKWTFKGASPLQAENQHPRDILYDKTGVFDVSLMASNANTSDTMEKSRYITVLPHIYPIPFSDHVVIDLGSQASDDFSARVYDILGREVKIFINEINPGTQYGVYLNKPVPGMYYLRMKSSGLDLNKKIMFIKTR